MIEPFFSLNSHKKWQALTGLMLVSSALVACHKQPVGQVIAVVNGQEITLQELAAEAQSTGVEADLSQKPVIAKLLQRVINRDILADYAKQAGIDRSPEYVLRRQQAAQTLLADMAARRIAGVSNFPTRAETDAYVASHPLSFAQRQKLTLDQVTFATPDNPAVLKSITNAPTFDAALGQLSAQSIKFVRSTSALDTAATDPALVRQILALKANEIFDFSGGGHTFVGVVTARNAVDSNPATWPDLAANAIRGENLAKAVGNSLKDLRGRAKIEYNSNYRPDK
jgi:EpsD family peptidyl-prolyl cis-trans isomerase